MKTGLFCSVCSLFTVVVFSCTGPRGPMGPAGPQGNPAVFVVDTGTLQYANYDSTVSGWNIPFPINSDSILVETWTRQSSAYVWSQPTSFITQGFVRIINDSLGAVGFGYQYMIVGIKPSGN